MRMQTNGSATCSEPVYVNHHPLQARNKPPAFLPTLISHIRLLTELLDSVQNVSEPYAFRIAKTEILVCPEFEVTRNAFRDPLHLNVQLNGSIRRLRKEHTSSEIVLRRVVGEFLLQPCLSTHIRAYIGALVLS